MFTCAGGDSWKDINHQKTLFDEDNDFAGKIFRYSGDGWWLLCKKHGLDPKNTAQTIQEIVNGQGLRGEIHEIADTASYMLGDVEEIRRVCERYADTPPEFVEILHAAGYPWDIWNCVAEKNGHVVVTNPVTLNNFLVLRILLWTKFYQNPRIKVLEMLMREIVYPYLVDKKLINISDLPTKGDTWLYSTIERHMGWQENQTRDLCLLGSFPKMKAFATWDRALAFEEYQYNSRAFTLVFSVEDFPKTNSKTDKYRVMCPDGRVETFRAAFYDQAKVIDEMAFKSMSPARPVHVVYVQYPHISPNLKQAWQNARARWKKVVEK